MVDPIATQEDVNPLQEMINAFPGIDNVLELCFKMKVGIEFKYLPNEEDGTEDVEVYVEGLGYAGTAGRNMEASDEAQ